jgi:hypothetical protein
VKWLLLFVTASAALAQSPDTVRYIQARDRAIEESKSSYEAFVAQYREIQTTKNTAAAEAYWKIQGGRLAELEREKLTSLKSLLTQAVGAFSGDGFGTEGAFNLDVLSPEGDFGRLDGLEYASRDGHGKVLITTRPLVSDWLGKFYRRPGIGARDVIQVLSMESQAFLTQAWAIEDQHFTLVDRLPVRKPTGATLALAFLGELCAEDENYVPDSILAEAIIGERVYLVSQSLSVQLPTFKECDRQWQKLWDSGRIDAAALAFNRCYTRRATSSPAYKAAFSQAQQLMNSLTH